jgi:exopolysaccharide production protein ExoZ
MDLRTHHSNRLDFLRGIAVLLVVSVHSSQIVGNGDQASNWAIPLSKNFLDFGARGVQIFFVLSAFGLAKSYSLNSGKPIRSFYTRRFFRIYPIWILAVFVHALIENRTQVIFQNATFAFGWLRGNQDNPEIVGGSWTLFVEIIFYILFPLLFPIARHTKTLVILILLLMALRVIWLRSAENLFGIVDRNTFIGLHPLSNFYCFALGLLIYNQISVAKRGKFKWTITVSFLLIFTIIFEIDQMLQVVLISFLMYSFLKQTDVKPKCHLGKIEKIIELFGKYAFTIYLYHLLILKIGSSFVVNATENLPYVEVKFFALMPIVMLILFILGKLGYQYLEKPSIKIGAMITSRFIKPKGFSNV